MSFASFGFRPQIAAGINRLGYVTPTPIQEKAIAPVLAGKDIMGLAETGTGKTAAFVLPALQRLHSPAEGSGRGPRMLILTPTRELAAQVTEATRNYGRFLNPGSIPSRTAPPVRRGPGVPASTVARSVMARFRPPMA